MYTGKTLRIKMIVLGMALLAVTGCSISPSSYSFGLNDSRTPSASPGRPTGSFAAPDDRQRKKTVAKSSHTQRDRAPDGSYTKAPAGAFADRSYGRIQLDAAQALHLINSYRSENGLKPLRLDALLTKAAKTHSRDLATWDRISHFGSDGSNPWERVKRSGYHARLAAENVGTGQKTFEEVMAGWKKSEGHNKNLLLQDAEHIGVALVYDANTEFRTFWTLVIGAPA